MYHDPLRIIGNNDVSLRYYLKLSQRFLHACGKTNEKGARKNERYRQRDTTPRRKSQMLYRKSIPCITPQCTTSGDGDGDITLPSSTVLCEMIALGRHDSADNRLSVCFNSQHIFTVLTRPHRCRCRPGIALVNHNIIMTFVNL